MPDHRPPDYREQDGCHNCSGVFRMSDYDCGDAYYCLEGAPQRPPCCSVGMGENDFERSAAEMCLDLQYPMSWTSFARLGRMLCRARGWTDATSQYEEWDTWSAGREVAPWGFCEHWEAVVAEKTAIA